MFLMAIRDVTDLEVYNLALSLLEPLYKVTNKLPVLHRRMKYQVNEAAEKIPPQIAEGFGKKKSPREFCRFLSMALGSSDEVITHLREIKIVAKTYAGIVQDDCDELMESYKILSKRLNRLLSAWQKFD
jgi:four helix bundle protein